MNPRLHKLLSGNLEIYPHLLEEKFPRVFNKLLELWQTPHIDAYLQDLMVDKRGGGREGFPPEAAMEIIRLSNYLHEMHSAGKEVQAWEDIPEYKRHELERYGYDFNAKGLLKSVEDNNQNAVQVFLSCGVDLEVRDDRNWTPLMVAAFNGNLEFTQLLLKCGARLSTRDKNGYTPLHWAAYNGHVDVLKFLIEKGAEPDIPSQYGWTALMQAATRGHLLACAYLIFRGADVNQATSDGWTSLHKAANNGHIEVVKLLLEKGANKFAKYQEGSTPIDLAIKAGHLDIVDMLNKHVDTKKPDGSEPLSLV
ncbi:MAG: ankyrin repeat domain-containing protein [Nitrosomonadales bacterium]|nr:ankyrin repeat domain-containing protein [Nitrosomonadales bacterium]